MSINNFQENHTPANQRHFSSPSSQTHLFMEIQLPRFKTQKTAGLITTAESGLLYCSVLKNPSEGGQRLLCSASVLTGVARLPWSVCDSISYLRAPSTGRNLTCTDRPARSMALGRLGTPRDDFRAASRERTKDAGKHEVSLKNVMSTTTFQTFS